MHKSGARYLANKQTQSRRASRTMTNVRPPVLSQSTHVHLLWEHDADDTNFMLDFVDMVIDNDPPITRHISVPRDMSQLSCSALTAGIVEAVLDGLGFVRHPHLAPRDPDPRLTLTDLHSSASTRYGPLGTDRSVSAAHDHPHQARQIRHGARRSPEIILICTQYRIQSSPANV
jgi:hypothetical protein